MATAVDKSHFLGTIYDNYRLFKASIYLFSCYFSFLVSSLAQIKLKRSGQPVMDRRLIKSKDEWNGEIGAYRDFWRQKCNSESLWHIDSWFNNFYTHTGWSISHESWPWLINKPWFEKKDTIFITSDTRDDDFAWNFTCRAHSSKEWKKFVNWPNSELPDSW